MKRIAILVVWISLEAIITVLAASGQRKATHYGYGSMNWVDPDRTASQGTMYETFYSKTIKGEVSYLVYLPPGYARQKTRRYPALYELHASGGTPRRDAPGVVQRLDKFIRAGLVPPMIVIFPNALRGATMYCDSRDGKYPVETVIVKDLIPHVDATYRTIASREDRALDGFSMGGFGAAHLGFKYPDVFGVVSIMAPPLLGPELTSPLPAHAWSVLFPSAMGSDLEYFRANDPFELVRKNADAIRDRTVIRIVAHEESEHWLAPQCERLHKLMMQHMIPHAFYYLSNVKSHNRAQVLDSLGYCAFDLFTTHFNSFAANGRPGQAGAAGPATSANGSEQFPDGSTGRSFPFHGVGGALIPAYIRKPEGPGPFPVIVMLHGGKYGTRPTYAVGRAMRPPTEDFIQAGWAVYSIDYRPAEKIAILPIEFDDSVDAIQQVRRLPFIDSSRVGLIGVSHGGQVLSRVISRVDVKGAVLEAPAAIDLIEDKKAAARGEPVAPILLRMMNDMEQQLGAPAAELETDPAKYGYSSAMTEVAQVRCPILILNGRNDNNSPVPVIEAYVKKLRAAGKQVETCFPENGPHGFYFANRDIPATKEAGRLVMAFFKQCFGE